MKGMRANRDVMLTALLLRGWYLEVDPPASHEQRHRGNPQITLWYLDGPKMTLEELTLRAAARP